MCNLYSLSRKLVFASEIINEKQKQSKCKVGELDPNGCIHKIFHTPETFLYTLY